MVSLMFWLSNLRQRNIKLTISQSHHLTTSLFHRLTLCPHRILLRSTKN